jgi:hypothetical protein
MYLMAEILDSGLAVSYSRTLKIRKYENLKSYIGI